jgi:rhamnose transport system substrate-binding protein
MTINHRVTREEGLMKNQHLFTRLAIAMLLLLSAMTGLGASSQALAQAADCATGGTGGAASPEASPSPGGATGGASPAAMAGINMAFVPKDIVNNYFAASFKGAQEAATETGGTVQQVGPDTPDAAGQVQFIQTLTQQGVQAIAVSANDPNALAPALKDARAKGIKVVGYDSDVAQDARDVFVNTANSEDIGRIQIQIISRLIGCSGEIAVLSAASTATNQNTWIDFMKDELTKPGYENVKLVEVVYGDDKPQLSYDKTVELLTAYPDLKGIVSPTTVGIAAAASALEAEGRTDVQLTGLGLPNEMRQYIKSGTVKEMALWNPIDLYYLTYYVSAALVSGEITGAEGDTFTAGRLGSYTVGANGVVLLGKPFIFNADNIDQFNF